VRQNEPESAGFGLRYSGGFLRERHGGYGLARSEHVQSGIDRSPAQVILGTLHRAGVNVTLQKPQKNCLQYVFGVRSVACDPIGSSENELMLVSEGLLELAGDRDSGFL